MIIFKKIKIKNFFSVGNTPIEIDLNKHRKTLISGLNGSGKTICIIDAIVFALYGKTFRKANKPTIINSINKSNLLVELDFSIGENNYNVRRGMKPNIFEIRKNDELLKEDAKLQDYQENIVKIGHKSFINVVVLGSARYNPFMKMKAAERREIIEELLDIQIFSVMNSITKSKITTITTQINKLDSDIMILNEKITLLKEFSNNKKNDIIKEITDKQKEIGKIKNDIKVNNENIIQLNNNIDTLLKTIEDKNILKSKKDKLIKIESKLESKISETKNDILFYNDNDSCPKCKQNIEIHFKQNELIELNKKQSEYNNAIQKLEESIIEIEERNKQIGSIENEILNYRNEIIRLTSTVKTLNEFLKKEINEIERLKNKEIENNENVDINAIQQNESMLECLNGQKNNLNIQKENYEYILSLLKDGGIKTKIIQQYLPLLNKYINEYLEKMDFFVNFNIDENFDEVIKSRYRDEFKYENFSNGQQMKIDLSILFAFRQIAKLKNSVNTNLLLMDEVLDSSLDSNAIDLFLDLLDVVTEKSNVYIITQRSDIMEGKIDRHLHFEMYKNFTKMNEVEV